MRSAGGAPAAAAVLFVALAVTLATDLYSPLEPVPLAVVGLLGLVAVIGLGVAWPSFAALGATAVAVLAMALRADQGVFLLPGVILLLIVAGVPLALVVVPARRWRVPPVLGLAMLMFSALPLVTATVLRVRPIDRIPSHPEVIDLEHGRFRGISVGDAVGGGTPARTVRHRFGTPGDFNGPSLPLDVSSGEAQGPIMVGPGPGFSFGPRGALRYRDIVYFISEGRVFAITTSAFSEDPIRLVSVSVTPLA